MPIAIAVLARFALGQRTTPAQVAGFEGAMRNHLKMITQFQFSLTLLNALLLVATAAIGLTLWGSGATRPSGNTIAMHVTRLRARLGPAVVVRRVRGRGYALDPCPGG